MKIITIDWRLLMSRAFCVVLVSVTLGCQSHPPADKATPSITSVNANADGTFSIQGMNLSAITGLKITGGAITPTALSVNAGRTDTSLVATAVASLNLVIATSYSLLVSTAAAQTAVAVTFTLPAYAVTTPATCNSGDLLTYGGSNAWSCSPPGSGSSGGGGPYLPIAGGTVSGSLVLNGTPAITVPATSKMIYIAPMDFKPFYSCASPPCTPWSSYHESSISRDDAAQWEYMSAHIPLPDGATMTGIVCQMQGNAAAYPDLTVTLEYNYENSGGVDDGDCESVTTAQDAGIETYPIVLTGACPSYAASNDVTASNGAMNFTLRADDPDTNYSNLLYGCTVTYTVTQLP